MRALPTIACAALLLAACGKKDAATQTSNASADVTAESFGGSDTTAIDAATASDANMAADVQYNDTELDALMNAGNAADEGSSNGN